MEKKEVRTSSASEGQLDALRVLQSKEETKSIFNKKIVHVYNLLAEHSEQPMPTGKPAA